MTEGEMDQYDNHSMSDADFDIYEAQQQSLPNACYGLGFLSPIWLQNSIRRTPGPYKSEAMNSRLADAKMWLSGRQK